MAKLDNETERVLLNFERAVSTYRTASLHDFYVRLAARNELRARIRTLSRASDD